MQFKSIKNIGYVFVFSVFCITALHAEQKSEEISTKSINELYDFIWSEIIRDSSNAILKKPVLDHINTDVILGTLIGTWELTYRNDREFEHKYYIIFEKNRIWKEIRYVDQEIKIVNEGYWQPLSDKIVLFRNTYKPRAFILLIKNKWYWNDADVTDGITPLIPKCSPQNIQIK